MMKLRWAVLFAALTVFLTACPGPQQLTATLNLTADPNPVPAAGAPVTLTAEITQGAENVASVDFAIKDATSALGSDADGSDGYTFTTATPVTAATTFVATARDSGGAAIGSAEVAVTVAAPTTVTLTLAASPNPVPVGGAPVTLTATITAGQSRVASVAFSIKTPPTPLGTPDTTAPYSFTTTTPVTAATTFVATARDSGGNSLATAEVAVTVTPGTSIPAGATKAATLDAIKAVTATTGDAAIIAVTADITCTDPSLCVQLKPGQTLVGANAAGTTKVVRKFTTNGGGARAVEMNNNTTVEGFEFDGTGIFIAVDAPDTVTGSVTIRNVTVRDVITAGGSNPIKISSTGAVTIDGLTIPNSIRTTTISGFSSLTVLNSSISYTLPATGVSSAFLAASQNATISIDGLTITSNRSDPTTFNPFFVNQILGAGTLNVTVKNSRVVVPVAGAATARSFVFGVDAGSTGGAVAINTAASTANTTNAGAGVTTSAGVTGSIALTVVP